MENSDLKDMQGLIKRGYGSKKFADFILLKIENATQAKQWLKQLTDQINTAGSDNPDQAINIAFTHSGFAKLGLTECIENDFLREFQEGMADKTRSRLLGDYDWKNQVSLADSWEWKDTGEDSDGNVIHVMLMLYATTQEILDTTYSRMKQAWDANGLKEFKRLNTFKNEHDKEHFGFHDGIAQPAIKDFVDQKDIPENTLSTGEFILGYQNEYGKLPDSPSMKDAKTKSVFDFGKNGSYLVMRQMEQDVKGFWAYIATQSKDADGNVDDTACVYLASRMVGRWPGGTPLTVSPDTDPQTESDENNFFFKEVSAENLGKCPVGSHVLRSNPRDMLAADKKTSVTVSNHHRILRRGRAYGKTFVDTMKPADVLQKQADNEKRGLFFICLNTNISRQFEFIQHTWINNEKFNGMYNDTDHIAGSYPGDFTIPQEPVRRHISNIPVFVKVRGGAYFFLPSISAIKFLSEL